MSTAPSDSPPVTAATFETRCPRCGVALGAAYKFCPNCAIRLRPDLSPRPPAVQPRAGMAQRLLAFGGVLAFLSLLLAVVLAGIQVFVSPGDTPGATEMESRTIVLPNRDLGTLAFDTAHLPKTLKTVEHGQAWFGVYDDAQAPYPYWVDDSFRICRYEVTNDWFYRFLKARTTRSGRANPPEAIPSYWTRPTGDDDVARIYSPGTGDEPVREVSHALACEFCAWVWETALERDPDLVVDLPTDLEFIRAGRGDSWELNFPWGKSFEGRYTNVGSHGPARVDSRIAGEHSGLFALVGNVAEWTWAPENVDWVNVAWGSFATKEDAIQEWRDLEAIPFGGGGFVRVRWRPDKDHPLGRTYQDVGLRIVVRHARRLPRFVKVAGGPVQYRHPPYGHLDVSDGKDNVRSFEIAESEITNWQYLAFLRAQEDSALLRRKAREDGRTLLPVTWNRPHPLSTDAVFTHPYGPRDRIESFYPSGEENLPVSGISTEQAEAYCSWMTQEQGDTHLRCRLPSAAQFVRAGRGDGLQEFPDRLAGSNWIGLNSREANETRRVALAQRYGDRAGRIPGLVGNVQEIVRGTARYPFVLAGGCYELPRRYCTLDAFLPLGQENALRGLVDDTDAGLLIRYPLAGYSVACQTLAALAALQGPGLLSLPVPVVPFENAEVLLAGFADEVGELAPAAVSLAAVPILASTDNADIFSSGLLEAGYDREACASLISLGSLVLRSPPIGPAPVRTAWAMAHIVLQYAPEPPRWSAQPAYRGFRIVREKDF